MASEAVKEVRLSGDLRWANVVVRKAGEEIGRVVGAAPRGGHLDIKTRYGLQGVKLRVELQATGGHTQVSILGAGFTYSAQVAATKCAERLISAVKRIAAQEAKAPSASPLRSGNGPTAVGSPGGGPKQRKPNPPELPRTQPPASSSASEVQTEVKAKAYQPKCPECDEVLMFSEPKKQYVCEACMIYVPPCQECASPMRFVEPAGLFECDQCARGPSRPSGRRP